MPQRLTPCSRAELIRKLRKLGYEGPYAGGKHQYMVKVGRGPVTLPNPHGEINADLLRRILQQANISREDWFRA